jgi:hypothetical protein
MKPLRTGGSKENQNDRTNQMELTLGKHSLFAWLISHQPAVLFSQNKSATSNQPAVLFSQNKPAPAINHQPTEQAVFFLVDSCTDIQRDKLGLRVRATTRPMNLC